MTVTLVDASNTPDHSTTDARVSEAGSTKIPLKARWSLYWQRAVLTLRYWFRLPIDDIKEARLDAQIEGLILLHQKSTATITHLTSSFNQLQARVQFYEQHSAEIKELKRRFEKKYGENLNHGVTRSSLILPPS